jgi:hypothetical protein
VSKGNPARWEPLAIGQAANPGGTFGMAAAFYSSGGQRHHYTYREPQPAVECLSFGNRLYNGWALVFEDGSMHLTFKRNDRAAVRDWRHFQAIKNEVAGVEREAIEVFPPESLLVDSANEYHLWVLPEGAWSPLGFAVPAVLPAGQSHDHADYRQGGPSGYAQREWQPGIPTGLGVNS